MLLAIVAIAGLSACGGDDEGSTPTPTATTGVITENQPIATIVVKDGAPVGGVQELEYDAGEQIRFTVRSNAADEIHIHGYDLEKPVPAGGSASFSFPADIEGIFEVELHESEQQIAELRVNP